MIAVWLEDGQLRVRDDLPVPEPGPGEALVRVAAAGICGTDLEMLRGYRPFSGVPGHELVGVVERGPDAWLGRRVVSEINVTCETEPPAAKDSGTQAGEGDPAVGRCGPCRAGRPTHCVRRTVVGIFGRDGGFAEHVALPVANLHAVPDAVPDDAATFVEPLAAALRIGQQIEIGSGDRALVVGFGRLGQLVARALAPLPISLDVADRSGRDPGPLAGRIRRHRPDEIPARAYDVAIDCTGHPDGFDVARRALRAGGTLVLKSTHAGTLTVDASSLVVDEIRVVGSRCGPFPAAIEALAAGGVEVLDLIDARFPLAEALEAYEMAARPGVAKVLLAP